MNRPGGKGRGPAGLGLAGGLLVLVTSLVPWGEGAASPRAAGATPGRLGAAAPLTTATQLPPLDPEPRGGPLAVGTPLATPAPAPNAIRPENVANLRRLAALEPPAGASESLAAFTADGRWMLTDGTHAWVRDARDGTVNATIPGAGALGFTPDGRYVLLAADGSGSLAFWDRALGAEARRHFGGGGIVDWRFAAGGAILAAVRSEDWLHVWDVADGRLRVNEPLYRQRLEAPVAFHPLAPDLAAAESWTAPGMNARRLDLATGAASQTFRSSPANDFFELVDLTWRPDGQLLVGLASSQGGILAPDAEVGYVWWSGASAPLTMRPDVRQTRGFSWHPAGRWLAIVEMRGAAEQAVVTLWDGSRFQAVAAEPTRHIEGLSWNADGSLLALGWEDWDHDRYESLVWDPAARQIVARIPSTTRPHFSPDGSRLVVQDQQRGGLALYGVTGAPAGRVWLPLGWR